MARRHPENHSDRTSAIAAVQELSCDRSAPVWLREELSSGLLATVARYRAARTTIVLALAEADVARTRAAGAHVAFSRRFRCWSNDLQDAQGRRISQRRKILFGGVLPSQLLKKPYKEALSLTTDLRELLALYPELLGDEDKLRAFLGARARLERDTLALDAKDKALRVARDEMRYATERFDADWRSFVKLLEGARPTLAKLYLPTFRNDRRRKAPEPSAPDTDVRAEADASDPAASEAASDEPSEPEPRTTQACGDLPPPAPCRPPSSAAPAGPSAPSRADRRRWVRRKRGKRGKIPRRGKG